MAVFPITSGDASTSIQAAIDALNGSGVLEIDQGSYFLDAAGIDLRKKGGGGGQVGIVCRNGPVTFIARDLPADQPALRINRVGYVPIGGPFPLSFQRQKRNADGSLTATQAANGNAFGTGIWVAPYPVTNSSGQPLFGTMSVAGYGSNLSVSGFDIGVRIGHKAGAVTNPDGTVTPAVQMAASEWVWDRLQLRGCNIGCKMEDYNTLDHLFTQLLMSGNKIGMVSGSGGGEANVKGGSSSNNGTDFSFATGGRFDVVNFRTEGVGTKPTGTPWGIGEWGIGHFVIASGGGYRITMNVRSCTARRSGNPRGNAPVKEVCDLIVGTHNAHLVLTGNMLGGPVWHTHHAAVENGVAYDHAGAVTALGNDFDMSSAYTVNGLAASDFDEVGNIRPRFIFGPSRNASPAWSPAGSNHRARLWASTAVKDNGAKTINLPDVSYG